ncbi:hypothetical protein [Polaromonas sp. UC242_47]|uniref:hypothetical protein n=1 Tax=Polaromonas sp. UC242_47 TaxID=3374626 RepID=UPI003795DB51
MTQQHRQVSTAAALLAATADTSVRHITVTESLADVPMLRLSPGQTLTGADPQTTLRFVAGQHGLQLSTDNCVDNLELVTDIDKWAVFNDTGVDQLGRLLLQSLVVHGVVLLLARDKVRGGHVEAHDVDIVAADARGYEVRPAGFGVEVIPGAFTLWNQQTDKAVTITAELTGLSAGRAGAPVHGSGIFVSGAGDVGGRMVVSLLETDAVYSHGGIAPGVANRISGGVFTVYGAFVDSVHNLGPVTTYGQNDMVLDNWGSVDSWVAEDKITSYGPSGIGFVNFGTVNELVVNAPIETFGQGSRGYNVYAGTVHSAEFDRVVTHADGAVGMQISQPVGSIVVHRGIETFGGTGDSLVKGVVVKLSAIALSFKPGAWAREVSIAGGLTTHGPGVNPLELHGTVDSLTITGGIRAAGEGF